MFNLSKVCAQSNFRLSDLAWTAEDFELLAELAVPEFHPKYLPESMLRLGAADEGPTTPERHDGTKETAGA